MLPLARTGVAWWMMSSSTRTSGASMLPEVPLPVLSPFSDWRGRFRTRPRSRCVDNGERSVAECAGWYARRRAELVVFVLVMKRALVRSILEPGDDPAVDDGHEEQREDQRAEQTADQHGAHRAPELGAFREPERERQHAEHHRGSGHDDRSQTYARGRAHRVDRAHPALAHRVGVVDEQDAVLRDEAEEHDDPDQRE